MKNIKKAVIINGKQTEKENFENFVIAVGFNFETDLEKIAFFDFVAIFQFKDSIFVSFNLKTEELISGINPKIESSNRLKSKEEMMRLISIHKQQVRNGIDKVISDMKKTKNSTLN